MLRSLGQDQPKADDAGQEIANFPGLLNVIYVLVLMTSSSAWWFVARSTSLLNRLRSRMRPSLGVVRIHFSGVFPRGDSRMTNLVSMLWTYPNPGKMPQRIDENGIDE